MTAYKGRGFWGSVGIALGLVLSAMQPAAAANPMVQHTIVEIFPDRIQAKTELYRRQLEAVAAANPTAAPFYIIVPKVQRWRPGSVVRVAFNGGSPALYDKIKDAALAWTQQKGAHLTLQFQDASGQYLQWTTADKEYAAQVRVSFLTGKDYGGYWSMVGTDSVTSAAGGSPDSPSMNFEGFDQSPPRWMGRHRHARIRPRPGLST